MGEIIDVIRSLYVNIKSRVKYNNRLSNHFTCLLGFVTGNIFHHFYFLCMLIQRKKLAGDGFKGVEAEM